MGSSSHNVNRQLHMMSALRASQAPVLRLVGSEEQNPLFFRCAKGTTMEAERLLTADQLAEILNVPLSYIRHRCHQKTIPFFKIGNHVRFRLSQIEEWLAEQLITPDGEEAA
jgi:excisionase family DNA binding protein